MANLAGLHDIEAAKILPPDTWVLDTIALGSNQPPKIYPATLNVIARLNLGYGGTGTIPVRDQYPDFAQKVARHVAGSQNCRRWIIGNEPNLPTEWPDGRPIFPKDYADCYRLCRAAIHALVGHERDEVLLAPIGPWNNQLTYPGNGSGDWIRYFTDVLTLLGGEIDGFALHAYTHGCSVPLVTSSARMDAPFQARRSEFRSYMDWLEAIPEPLRKLNCYITEADGNGAWQAVGLMPAMLSEIDNWNLRGLPKIQCVIFYRFTNYDPPFGIDGKADVLSEFRAAASRGYASPDALIKGEYSMPDSTSSPAVNQSVPSSLPPRQLTPDFQKRVPQRTLIADDFAQPYYRLIKAEYVPDGAQRFGPDHHILVEVLNEKGEREMDMPVRFWWGSGFVSKPTDKMGGPYAVDYDMSNPGYSFGCQVGTGIVKSDSVFGMGLGTIEQVDWKIHVTYYLVFQKVIPQVQTAPAPSVDKPSTYYITAVNGANFRDGPNTDGTTVLAVVPYGAPVSVLGFQNVWAQVVYQGRSGWISKGLLAAEANRPNPPTQSQPSGDKWQRTINFILNEEGGYTANDEGSPANFGINQGANPDLDVAHITRDQAIERYRTGYWIASGADQLPWPFCLQVMDAAVQHGVEEAKQLLTQSGGNMLLFQGLRQLFYGQIKEDSWQRNGRAWMNRMGKLLVEASK